MSATPDQPDARFASEILFGATPPMLSTGGAQILATAGAVHIVIGSHDIAPAQTVGLTLTAGEARALAEYLTAAADSAR